MTRPDVWGGGHDLLSAIKGLLWLAVASLILWSEAAYFYIVYVLVTKVGLNNPTIGFLSFFGFCILHGVIIIVYHYFHVDVVFLVNLRHVYVRGGCHVSAEVQKEQIAIM